MHWYQKSDTTINFQGQEKKKTVQGSYLVQGYSRVLAFNCFERSESYYRLQILSVCSWHLMPAALLRYAVEWSKSHNRGWFSSCVNNFSFSFFSSVRMDITSLLYCYFTAFTIIHLNNLIASVKYYLKVLSESRHQFEVTMQVGGSPSQDWAWTRSSGAGSHQEDHSMKCRGLSILGNHLWQYMEGETLLWLG